MDIKKLSYLLFVASDVREQSFELLSQHLHSERARFNDSRVAGERLSGLYAFQPILEFLLAAALMSVKNFRSLCREAFFSYSRLSHYSRKSASKALFRSLSNISKSSFIYCLSSLLS